MIQLSPLDRGPHQQAPAKRAAYPVHQGQLEYQENLDDQENLELLDCQEHPAVHHSSRANLSLHLHASLVLRDLLGHRENPAKLDRQVPSVIRV